MVQDPHAHPSDTFHYLEEFMAYFSGVRERSPRTLREYRYELRCFFRWLKRERLGLQKTDLEEIDISDIDLEFLRRVQLSEVYRYISWLANERSNAAASRARSISAIRSFFNYMTGKLHLLETNPVAELEGPKIQKSLPRYLNPEESAELLRCAATADSRFSERDLCILMLFLNCGLRLSELTGLDVEDVKDGQIRILGKGNKERILYLNEISKAALDRYLAVRPLPASSEGNPLFVSRNRRRISNRSVQNIVKKYIEAAGLDSRKYSTHKLRHTAATLLYQYGHVDLRSLQQILGHESVATTEIYTHVGDEQLREAVSQNPLNHLSLDELSEHRS